jgi:hypothetical protein
MKRPASLLLPNFLRYGVWKGYEIKNTYRQKERVKVTEGQRESNRNSGYHGVTDKKG